MSAGSFWSPALVLVAGCASVDRGNPPAAISTATNAVNEGAVDGPKDDLRPLLSEALQLQYKGISGPRLEAVFQRAASLPNPDVESLRTEIETGVAWQVIDAMRLLKRLDARATPAVPFVLERLHRTIGYWKTDRERLSDQERRDLDTELEELVGFVVSETLGSAVSTAELLRLLEALPRFYEAGDVARSLRDRGVRVEEVVPRLRRFLDDPDRSARYSALGWLQNSPAPSGTAGADVRRKVIEMCISDPHRDVRWNAGHLMGLWTLDASLGLETMISLLKSRRPRDPDESEHATLWGSSDSNIACRIASGLRGDLTPALQALETLSREADPMLRARAVVALGEIRFEEWRQVEKAVGRIEEMRTGDPDPLVREAAEIATELVSARGEQK